MANPAPRSKDDRGSGNLRVNYWIETLAKIPKVAFISIMGPAFLLVVGYVLWVNYGAKHLNKSLYGLHIENISLTPQPTWIQSSVLTEVFQGSELGRLSVIDRQMTPALYNAFRTHPWIRQVFRAYKLTGAQVRVDVEYREPLAMVYCEISNQEDKSHSVKGQSLNGKPVSASGVVQNSNSGRRISFLPVDADAVLLPTQDFKPDQVPQFILIYAQDATPIGMIGSEYGDVRIKEALRLCRLLKDVREKFGIERIYVYPDQSSQGPSRWSLEITTKNKKIRWGHPPGLEAPGEPGFPAKLRKLGEFLLNPTQNEVALSEMDLVISAKPTLGSKLSPQP